MLMLNLLKIVFYNNKNVDNWYSFNDSSVTEIKVESIQTLFGTEEKGSYAATGYVLMYRQVTLEKITTIEHDLIDQELRKLIDEENEKIKEEEKKWKEKFNNISLKISYNGEILEIPAKKTQPIKEFKYNIIELFKIEAKPENTRLRSLNNSTHKMQDVFDDEEKVKYFYHIKK